MVNLPQLFPKWCCWEVLNNDVKEIKCFSNVGKNEIKDPGSKIFCIIVSMRFISLVIWKLETVSFKKQSR